MGKFGEILWPFKEMKSEIDFSDSRDFSSSNCGEIPQLQRLKLDVFDKSLEVLSRL